MSKEAGLSFPVVGSTDKGLLEELNNLNSETNFVNKEQDGKDSDKLSWASQYGGGNRSMLDEFLNLSNLTDEQKLSVRSLVKCLEDANKK